MKKALYYVLTGMGAALIIAGLWLLPSSFDSDGFMRVLPYYCIGVGCGLFGYGLGEIISRRAMRRSPEIGKQIEIEKNDERNVLITNRAKGRAFDAAIYIFAVLITAFGLIGCAPYVILSLISAYLLFICIFIFYRVRYDKEM